MKILIETCLDDLYILLFKNYKIIDKILIKNLIKKSEIIAECFYELLQKNNLNVQQIEAFYVTKGPGSFMGLRAGLLFIQIMAGVINKKIYACTTLEFLQKNNEAVYIDARGGSFYALINKEYSLKKGNYKQTKTNYEYIENNLMNVLKSFKKINPFKNNAFYIKEPKIG